MMTWFEAKVSAELAKMGAFALLRAIAPARPDFWDPWHVLFGPTVLTHSVQLVGRGCAALGFQGHMWNNGLLVDLGFDPLGQVLSFHIVTNRG